jgi:mitochondrial inner membrane protease ATP23
MVIGPVVVFMLEHLKRNGCNVKPEHIICAPCSSVRSGGFTPSVGAVSICQEAIRNRQHMEDTLSHELVHMYDHCKFNVDWTNLRHHACSEVCLLRLGRSKFVGNKHTMSYHQIRANNLSGDCKFTREVRRGFLSFSKQHQVILRGITSPW